MCLLPDVAHSACMPTVEHSACMPDVAHSACVPTVEHSACMLMWNNLASTLSPTLHTKLNALPVPIAIQVFCVSRLAAFMRFLSDDVVHHASLFGLGEHESGIRMQLSCFLAFALDNVSCSQ